MTLVKFLNARLDEDEEAARYCLDLADQVHGVGDGLTITWAIADHEPHPCPTLRHLASVYANHPDFQQDWKP